MTNNTERKTLFSPEWIEKKLGTCDDSDLLVSSPCTTSCFKCGRVGEPSIRHLIHHDVYICAGCCEAPIINQQPSLNFLIVSSKQVINHLLTILANLFNRQRNGD
jgi:hypothetical protein